MPFYTDNPDQVERARSALQKARLELVMLASALIPFEDQAAIVVLDFADILEAFEGVLSREQDAYPPF